VVGGVVVAAVVVAEAVVVEVVEEVDAVVAEAVVVVEASLAMVGVCFHPNLLPTMTTIVSTIFPMDPTIATVLFETVDTDPIAHQIQFVFRLLNLIIVVQHLRYVLPNLLGVTIHNFDLKTTPNTVKKKKCPRPKPIR
jgi:hypothetical protein